MSLASLVPKDTQPKQPVPSLDNPAPDTPLIELRDVVFAYPSRPIPPVLRSISLKIYPGQFIALVGPSGCGKSTIIQLLERFYDIQSGDILIGGISIKDLDPDDMRKLFALVSQEPVLYAGSIASNIMLGSRAPASSDLETPDTQELDTFLQQAQLTDLVASLPDGLNTQVGTRGTSLSGGQKQRVAIARALAQEAPILLLDEATSALDSESEHEIQKALLGDRNATDALTDSEGDAAKPIARTKTVIAVAHRLSTIQRADCIFVLDGGRVAECGKHAELLGRKGVYWGMVRAQAGTGEA